jgi:hypothetical protein
MLDARAKGLGSVTQGRQGEKLRRAYAHTHGQTDAFRWIVAYGKQEFATSGTDIVRSPVFRVKVAVPCT